MSNIDFQNGFAVGATATARNVQADWNQNDSSAANFIRNKPFYEKNGTVQYNLDSAVIYEGDDIMYLLSSSTLNVSEGETVQCKIVFEDDSREPIIEETTVFEGGEEAPGSFILQFESILIVDKMNNESNYSENSSIAAIPEEFYNLGATVIVTSNSIKKIDKKFLPDDIATKLEVATYDTLGGVAPVEKTDEMTQEIGIDEEGRLFTAPAPELPDIPSIETTDTIQENSTSVPTSGAVYSFLMDIISEVEY